MGTSPHPFIVNYINTHLVGKKKPIEKANFHNEISDFDIKINEFGELQTNMHIDKINNFLLEKVDDKKLKSKTEEE